MCRRLTDPFYHGLIGLSLENSRSIAVSTQQVPFRSSAFQKRKVKDKFQENIRIEGPTFVESFSPDRGKGFKIRGWPFPTTSCNGLYQLHLFQTGAKDTIEMLTLILNLMSLLLFFRTLPRKT